LPVLAAGAGAQRGDALGRFGGGLCGFGGWMTQVTIENSRTAFMTGYPGHCMMSKL